MITAIVLAGASADNFNQKAKSRAMIEVAGVTMLDRVVNSLVDVADEVIAVGDVSCGFDIKVLQPGGSLMENISIALKVAQGDNILLCTSDIPFVSKKIMREFAQKSMDLNVGFVYPICPKEKCMEIYPTLKRTYVKIKEGEFTGGNVMFMTRAFLSSVLPVMQDLYLSRKSPLKLAKMIGFDIIWRLILCKINPKALNIEFLENKISGIFKDKVKALIVEDPSLCEDLDSPEELVKFEEILAKGEG